MPTGDLSQVLVSVVIPAYNQAAYLREALASALAQTHRELEVVVVDDGSTDDTAQVCASFGDARVRYVRQDNDGTRGIGARNQAMLLARGEWIALLDQDDRWDPPKLERQLALAAQHAGVGAVFTRVRFIDPAGLVTGTQDSGLPQGEVYHDLLVRNRYYASAGIFKRSLLGVAGLPGESCGLADWHLWLAVARHAPVAVIDEAFVDYRLHPEGYQLALLQGNSLRFATDQWKTVHGQAMRLHEGCVACRRAHRKARRDVAHLCLRSARINLQAGRPRVAGRALATGWDAAPGWLLLPWVLLPQGLRLILSALRGALPRSSA